MELKAALASLGEKLTDAEAQDIIEENDEDGSATMDLEEFMNLIEQRIRDKELMDYSFHAFKMFSETKENHLTHKELMDILGNFKKSLSQNEMDEIIKSLPWEDDKTINIENFLAEFFEHL